MMNLYMHAYHTPQQVCIHWRWCVSGPTHVMKISYIGCGSVTLSCKGLCISLYTCTWYSW